MGFGWRSLRSGRDVDDGDTELGRNLLDAGRRGTGHATAGLKSDDDNSKMSACLSTVVSRTACRFTCKFSRRGASVVVGLAVVVRSRGRMIGNLFLTYACLRVLRKWEPLLELSFPYCDACNGNHNSSCH